MSPNAISQMKGIRYRTIDENDCEPLEKLYFQHRGYKIAPINHVQNDDPRVLAELKIDGEMIPIGFAYASKLTYNIAESLNIFVHPDYRGFGIGKLLYQERLKQITERGFADILFLNSASYKNHDNGAKIFHEKNGNKIIWDSGKGSLLFHQNIHNSQCLNKPEISQGRRFCKNDIYAFYNTLYHNRFKLSEQIKENELIAIEKGYPNTMLVENLNVFTINERKNLISILSENGYKMSLKTTSNISLFIKYLKYRKECPSPH